MSRSKRKLEHIKHALNIGQSRMTGLDDIQFVHQSLPDCSVEQINLNTKIGELEFSSPIFINAMTGGGGEATLKINKELAVAARETKIPLAVGSQMSAIKDPGEAETFKIVRTVNRDGVIFANLGSEATVDEAKKAIEMIEADALQIHLNTIQELTMPEGDRDFTGTLMRIEKIIHHVNVPVIVKEVGFGMGKETVETLKSIGAMIIDVGGYGGTNFARIENERRSRLLPFFNQWGVPTAVSIIEAYEHGGRMEIIASGGIQTSLDVVKSLSLGAKLAGMSGKLLKILINDGCDALINEINQLKEEIKFLMAALGAKSISQLQQSPLIIKGETHHWLKERGIDTRKYSQRKGPDRL